MNITKKDVDSLNAVVTVEIQKDDYAQKVNDILNNYRKSANIPGFRKGHVPMGMVRKQYGKAVLVEEVNKLLQDNLGKFLTEEKLEVLGNPLPKNEQDIDWDGEDFSFQFDLGLAPDFDVKLQGRKNITQYKVVADDEMIDNQVKTIRKQYGKLINKQEVEAGDEITGTFTSDEKEMEQKTTFETEVVKGKSQLKAILGAKPGDVIELKTKNLFADEHQNTRYLGVSQEEAKGLDITVKLTLEEVNARELAEMDQELFDKLFGPGVVTSEEALRQKIKEDAESQFVQQSDQKLLNDVVDSAIENTKFDLPEEFLQRWIQVSGEKELTDEEAQAEWERSEKGLRYQLIEAKLRKDNNLEITFEELKSYASDMIRAQMAQFGQTNPTDEEVEGIVARIMANQDEVRRMSEQLGTNKMLDFYKENAKLKTKEVNYETFIKEAYA
ncbi:trigger factor [Aureitalea marina]|uniref:Trigger factor n=1 Tax=Aureitalea marina TaxID=930804 RepID=A0A2S7KRC6_9FLAO|nr:trigger factor [Aureitalea marina]PQB05113.1 trigger factor [Aureitalea marina]